MRRLSLLRRGATGGGGGGGGSGSGVATTTPCQQGRCSRIVPVSYFSASQGDQTQFTSISTATATATATAGGGVRQQHGACVAGVGGVH